MGTFRKNLQESLKWLKSVRQFDKLMTVNHLNSIGDDFALLAYGRVQ